MNHLFIFTRKCVRFLHLPFVVCANRAQIASCCKNCLNLLSIELPFSCVQQFSPTFTIDSVDDEWMMSVEKWERSEKKLFTVKLIEFARQSFIHKVQKVFNQHTQQQWNRQNHHLMDVITAILKFNLIESNTCSVDRQEERGGGDLCNPTNCRNW